MALLTKVEIKEKLIAGDPIVELKKSTSSKSQIWQNYLLVYVDNIRMSWAYCIKCNDLVTYTACTGTGGLHRHRCNKIAKMGDCGDNKRAKKQIKRDECNDYKQEKKLNMLEQGNEYKSDQMIKDHIDVLKEEIVPMDFLENIYQEDNLCVEGYANIPDMSSHTKLKLNALTKAEIKEKIAIHDPSIELRKPKDSKTQVWQNFRLIYMANKKLNWAYCTKCTDLVGYSPRTGTGGLHRHRCAKLLRGKINDKSSGDFVVKREPLTTDALNEISRKQLSLITKDLLPFSVLEGEGFLELAQSLIDIGAHYGTQNVADIFKSRKTITRVILPMEYEKTKASVETQLSDQYLAFAIDIWTDKYTQRNFLTLTAHHITSDFKLDVNVLANREFAEEHKVGNGILDLVFEILNQFNLEQRVYSRVFVTDNDPSVKTAFKNYKRLSCACQNLNLVMNDVLEQGNIQELNVLIAASKSLVTYFELTELNNKLTEPLEQHIKSGWNSIFTMLSSILKVYHDIQNVLVERNELKRLTNIDYNFLSKLIEFLQPFKECSERLSLQTEPVIQEYVLWHQKLLNLCIIDTLDSEVIRVVKTAIEESLIRRFEPNNIHYVALFLNPPFKDLNCLPIDKREQVVASVKAMLTQIYDNNRSNPNNVIRPSCSDNSGSNRFAEFYNTSFSVDNYENEVNKQISIYMEKDIHCMEPILSFWSKQDKLYLLQDLSKQILCVPPSSTISEQVFSASSRLLEQRRRTLLKENLNEIIFLNKNMK